MIKIKIVSLLLICILTAAFNLSAQKLNEGKLIFDITIVDTDMSDEYLAMMPTQLTKYIKNDKMRIEMAMGMGNSQTFIFDNKEKTMTILMDMMGNKIAVKSTEEEIKKEKESKGADEIKVEKKDETKDIAGYKCKKAVVTKKDETYDIYYTDEIVVKGNDWNNDYKGIDGFPMEYQIKNGNTTMKMTAKTIEKQKVDDALFVVPEGYTLKTSEEIKKMYGGGQ